MSTTISIPSTYDEWLALVRQEVHTDAAVWIDLATTIRRKVEEMSPAVLDREFFALVAAEPGSGVRRPEVAIAALTAAFAPDDSEQPEEDKALEEEIWQAIKTIHPPISWSTAKRRAVIGTAAYQYGNWKAGRYQVDSADMAVQQFARRMRRTHPTVDFEVTDFIWWSLMVWLRNKAAGKMTLPRRKISTSTYDMQDAIIKAQPEIGYDKNAVDTYTLGWATTKVLTAMNKVEDMNLDVLRSSFDSKMRSNTSQEDTLDAIEPVFDWLLEHYLGQTVVTPELVLTIEGLEKFLLEREGDIEPFLADSIKRGLADTIDQVKEDEVPKDKVRDTFLLNVRSYGHQRFTGGGRLRVTSMLTVLESVRGKGLTAEEWKERYARFVYRVGCVSGRYGEMQSMCETLEKATAELGVALFRRPEGRTVLFTSDDLVIRVPVGTWYTDESMVLDKAKTAWRGMSAADRKKAVVKQDGVHVDWSAMKVK